MMRIPCGLNQPDAEIVNLLNKVYWHECKVIQESELYFIEITAAQFSSMSFPLMQLELTLDNDRPTYSVSFKNILIFTSKQNPIDVNNDYTVTIDPQAAYRLNLDQAVLRLENIVFYEGAQRGYGKDIKRNLEYLAALRAKNPSEHDNFIATNENYKKLWKLFPNWIDKYGLQPDFEAMDNGVVVATFGELSNLGLPPRAQKILLDEHFAAAEERRILALQESDRRWEERRRLDFIKSSLIVCLRTYSSTFKFSIRFSMFGHHHEGRVRAVMQAIKDAPSIEIIYKLLNQQLTLLKEKNPPLTGENIVSSDLLIKRWQGQLPINRALTPASQKKSGYIRAIQQALDLLPPRITTNTTITPSTPQDEANTATDRTSLLRYRGT